MKNIQKLLSIFIAMSIVFSLSTLFASAEEKTGSADTIGTYENETPAHTHDYEFVSMLSPTSDDYAGLLYKCKYCDETYIERDWHQFSDWYVLQSGTGTEGKIWARKCEECGKIIEQKSPIHREICGEECEYEINLETGLCTVSGTGDAEVTYLMESEYRSFIKDIVFEEGIEAIWTGEIYSGHNLRVNSITIPSSVTCFSGEADYYVHAKYLIVTDLSKFCETGITDIYTDGGLLFGDRILCYNGEEVNTLVVPSDVRGIGSCAFEGYEALTDVVFPANNSMHIEEYAFRGCKNLKSVTFYDPYAFAWGYAFEGCTSLTDVYYYGTPEQLQYLLEEYSGIYDETVYEKATIHFCTLSENNSLASDISFEPSINYRNSYSIKVDDRANMLQFIELDKGSGTGTRSFTRYNDDVSIVSYDKDGNIVSSTSKDLAYEIWSIETPLAEGNIGVRVKASGSSKWESRENAYVFKNKYATPASAFVSFELAEYSGKVGTVDAVVKTTTDVSYVQLKMDDGTTVTYSKDKATLNDDGNLVFNMKAWINHSGNNTVSARILTANGWQMVGTVTYYAHG